MLQITDIKRLGVLAAFGLLLAGVSVFGDERPDWRTAQADLRVTARAGDTIEGVVERITRDGDDIFLRSGRRTVRIEAHGGIKAWYRGTAYRIRDLEPGDLIRVDLDHRRGGRFRAESVQVLRSVSHDGRRGDRWNDDYRDRDRYGDRYRDRDRYRDHDRYREGRTSRIEGRIIELDRSRREMVVRVDRGRALFVDFSRVDRARGRGHGHGPSLRSIRVGDVVRIDGWYDGRVFVARSLDELHGRERGRKR